MDKGRGQCWLSRLLIKYCFRLLNEIMRPGFTHMKNKIKLMTLSVQEISDCCAKRINTFCSLLSDQLNDKWRVSNEEETFHVVIRQYDACLVRQKRELYPTIYLIEDGMIEQPVDSGSFQWFIRYPIFSDSLVDLLNEISLKVDFSENKKFSIPDFIQNVKERFGVSL